MKILAIQSSNRPDGLTAALAKACLDGAVEAAAAKGAKIETEIINLNEYKVNVCKACGPIGWGQCRQGEPCVQEDDVKMIREKMLAADAIILASPVYFWDLSESMRVFLDRIRRLAWHLRDKNPLAGKHLIGICAAGGSGTGAVSAIKSLEGYSTYLAFNNVAYIPVSRQNQELQMKASHEAGKHLAGLMLQ
jgi:multimeric flavodoxin WrbA